jgi:uncharacterized protein YigA (DUF484 family)
MTANKPIINPATDDGPGEAQVLAYLQKNPEFFQRQPEIIDSLLVSHRAGSAVSLVEKQVAVLRERNVEMRKRLNSLTENARDNDRLYEQTRKLVLRLLEATDMDQLSASFNATLQDDFGVEHSSIIMFGDPEQSTPQLRVVSAVSAGIEIGALLRGGKALCGALRKEELKYLFPSAGEVGSAALMPLADQGLIAVGSSDAHHYTSNMGTVFLTHTAEVLLRLLPRLQHPD